MLIYCASLLYAGDVRVRFDRLFGYVLKSHLHCSVSPTACRPGKCTLTIIASAAMILCYIVLRSTTPVLGRTSTPKSLLYFA